MITPGSIVLQDKTRINKVNYNDNANTRFSIVLFTYTNNGKTYACTAPVISRYKALNKIDKSISYLYIPNTILNEKKFSVVKLDATYLYEEKELHSTSFYIDLDLLININKQLLLVNLDSEIEEFIKSEIKKSLKKLRQQKRKIKEQEKIKKETRKLELKQAYKK